MGCPIRKSAGQRPFAPPHSLSQLTTSFIASESQGIPRVPLLAYYKLYLTYFAKFCPNVLLHVFQLTLELGVLLFLYFQYVNELLFVWVPSSGYLVLGTLPSIYSIPNTLYSVVENIGVEPMTPCVQGRCSSQLS